MWYWGTDLVSCRLLPCWSNETCPAHGAICSDQWNCVVNSYSVPQTMSAFPGTEFLQLSLKFQWDVPSGGKPLVPIPSPPRDQAEKTVSFLDTSLWINPSEPFLKAGFYGKHVGSIAGTWLRGRRGGQRANTMTASCKSSKLYHHRNVQKAYPLTLQVEVLVSEHRWNDFRVLHAVGTTSYPWTLLISFPCSSRAHEFAPIK